MARLISGTAYSLKHIFSGENDKVIIPDLQRDYCWGNPYSNDSYDCLVNSFIDSIFKLDKSSDITMGLIYGYYDEQLTPYHLQLCDGQQRLTSLFLIMGVINRKSGDNRYRKLLISDFELNEDDSEPHLLYGIRESSLYFLSDLTLHYFLNPKLQTDQIDKQPWFLNSYYKDPTITSMISALNVIESRLEECKDICSLGDFLIDKLKFLFYDMNNRQNGEETFVVINTTGEPLSANQNLKPLIIMENSAYKREGYTDENKPITYDTAHDWEVMETWFWKNRHRNDVDTSNEGMIAFLHCVRILESNDMTEWYRVYETNENKFPVSIKMNVIWEWFCAYKRIYELNYDRLCTRSIVYPVSQQHYTQIELYAILPAMVYCKRFPDASDFDIQRVYHIFSNMAKYRNTNRSSRNEPINVPAFRLCRIIDSIDDKDILSLLSVADFNVKEEIAKLQFINNFKGDSDVRFHIEELFAKAEMLSIYEGQIATLVEWSNLSVNRLDLLFDKINTLWGNIHLHDKIRQALLAFDMPDYPMSTGTSNHTLCIGTEWRSLFERQGDKMQEFLMEGDLDEIIESHKNPSSPYLPLIEDISYMQYSQDKKIRLHSQNVIELMSKTRARADFILFHNGVAFVKNMVDTKYWSGFWVWSDGEVSVFYTKSIKQNLTLDMKILDDGYKIIAWVNRNPEKTTVRRQILEEIGFSFSEKDNYWEYPLIAQPKEAKEKFIEITNLFVEKSREKQ